MERIATLIDAVEIATEGELVTLEDLERIDAEIAATEPYWTASELREYENWLMQMEWVYEE